MITQTMYRTIKRFKRQGYTKTQIATTLALDPKTVAKYDAMDDQTFTTYRQRHRYRDKVFDPYQPDILDCYRENEYHPLNMAAVYDYLEERHGPLPANEQTLRNYIQYLIQTGTLQLEESIRMYMKVPELPYGQQLQLDFGQIRCRSGFQLFIFATVLAASRYKYVIFQDHPFRTPEVIEHLLTCFEYIGGVPKELVIDQDHLLVVSENAGDILYTEAFHAFIEEQALGMYVCRTADPESKGKVENLIKYVKQNFCSVRDFTSLADANAGVLQWLDRRANGKISQATKKIPALLIAHERLHLRSLRHSIFRKDSLIGREERTADEKACISVEACRYQLPVRYRKTTVEIYVTPHQLFVFDQYTGEEIVTYALSPMPGRLISKRAYRRESEQPLQELKTLVRDLFPSTRWQQFVDRNAQTFPRYIRDQCLEAKRSFQGQDIDREILEQALTYCLDHETLSCANLHDTYQYFARESTAGTLCKLEQDPGYRSSHGVHAPIDVTERTLAVYTAQVQTMGRVSHESI